jgi:hypothetical protein
MKRFLHIAALLLLAVSCEIPFDLDQDGEPKIYVQAIVKGAHVHIVPLVANSVTGTPVADAPMEIRVELNGASLPVHPEDSISYAASSRLLREGDEISVTVRSGSLAPVTGSTHFPPALVVEDFSWERVQVDTIDAVQVAIKLDHEPGEGEYYGIRILQQDYMIFPSVVQKAFYRYITPGYVLTADEIGGFDLEDFVQDNQLAHRPSAVLALQTEHPTWSQEEVKTELQRMTDLYHQQALDALNGMDELELKRLLYQVTEKILG